MKKSFLTFAAIALVFSFTSCKETTPESNDVSESEVMETETEIMVEEVETPLDEVVVDSTTTEEVIQVEENITETPAE